MGVYVFRPLVIIIAIILMPSLSFAQASKESSGDTRRSPQRPTPPPRNENPQQSRLTPQEMLEARRTPGAPLNASRTSANRRLWKAPVVVKKAPVQKRLYEGTSLTPQQEADISAINASYNPRLAALARGKMKTKEKGPSPEAARLYDEYRSALDAVLTPAQRLIVEKNRSTIESGARQAAAERAIQKSRRPKDSLPPVPQRRIRR